ncbi:MAG: RDD family protein [Blastocatellia bacterium]
MKCENCGNELIGGAIICRVCDHNNARRAVNEWRSRRTGDLEKPRPTNPTGEPVIVPRKDREVEAEPNLLRFPATPPAAPVPRASAAPAPAESAAYPPWRDQVKEKVRLAREKRSQDSLPIESSAVEVAEQGLDQNPIVESALRRIRYASYSQTATARVARPSSAAPAAAPLPVAEKPPAEAPRPTPPGARTSPPPARPEAAPSAGNPFVKPRTTKDLAEKPQTRTLTPRTASTSPQAEHRPPQPSPSRALPRREAARTTDSRPGRESRGGRAGHLDPPEFETTTRLAVSVAGGPNDSFETEIIEMPQVPTQWAVPEARPATIWLRTMAGACDFELIASAYLPLFGAYATLNTSLGTEAFFVMLVLLTALVFIYQLATLLVADRTTGMAMLNLRLVNTDDDEMPVTRRQKMLRAWAATIAFLCPPLNLLITRLNYPNRSLPDLISGTTIIGN